MATTWAVLIDASSNEQIINRDKLVKLEVNSGTASQLDFLFQDGTTVAFDAGTSAKADVGFEKAKSFFFTPSIVVFDASGASMVVE